MKKLLAPSILSADFSRLGEEIKTLEKGQADWIHVDVMDGHFVPNLTIGPPVVKALKPLTRLPLDCHLMVSDPATWIDAFSDAGASVITVHVEATNAIERLLARIRALGIKAGVSLNPATPVSKIEGVLDQCDLVLVMSVNPGFGGQAFMPEALPKIKRLSDLRAAKPEIRKYLIEVDGGIGESNIGEVSKAGADVIVAGSAVFKGGNPIAALQNLRSLLAR